MMRSGKRILLLAVAALLSGSALLAIGILLVGHFGQTEGRILATTALLAGYGLLALPSTILLDQGRLKRLAVGALAFSVAGASLALAALWMHNPSASVGKAVGTATAFAFASAQASALAARRRERDPISVRRLFALANALAPAAAAMFAALLWAEIERESYVRLLAALVVLDLLVVALQPLLVRARPVGVLYRLRIVVAPDEAVVIEVDATDLATAAAKAIRTVERDGRRVLRLEVGEQASATAGGRQPAASGSMRP
jgi:MFS family permease